MKLSTLAARSLVTLVLAFAPGALTGCAVESTEELTTEVDAQDIVSKAGRFETFIGQDGQHYFHLIAKNGEKVLVSEGYATRVGAEAGVKACQKYGVEVNNFDLQQAKNGEYYFDLLAANGEVVGTSELYTTKSSAVKAIHAVAKVISASLEIAGAPIENPNFVSFKGIDGKFYFHLRASNGQIVLHSQGYASEKGAQSGIASVEANGATASNFGLREASDGRQYFVLYAKNHKVIGVSQMYASAQGAKRGVDAVVNLLATEM
jgi:uncharacterized protein YegP (UPF0339 family)